MSYFNAQQTTQVDLPNNYWVKVKKDLRFGDVKNFLQVSDDGKISNVAAIDAFMKSVIVEWNLDDGDGLIAPIDSEHINQLSKEDAIAIVNAAGAAVIGEKQGDSDFLSKSEASSTPEQ